MSGGDDPRPTNRDIEAAEEERRRLADEQEQAALEHERREVERVRSELRRHDERLASGNDD